MLWALAYNIVLLLCCGYALWRGGGPERLGAAMMFAGSMLSWAALDYSGTFHASVETGIFAVDVALLVGLGAIALFSDRFWPLWATGFHLVGVLTHGAVLAGTEVAPLAYAHALGLWSYLTLFSLAAGTRALNRPTAPSASGFWPRWSSRFGRAGARRSPGG